MTIVLLVAFCSIGSFVLGVFVSLKFTGVIEGWVQRIEGAFLRLGSRLASLELALRSAFGGKAASAAVSEASAVKVASQPVEASNGEPLKGSSSAPVSVAQSGAASS